jgi:hypothetical protein
MTTSPQVNKLSSLRSENPPPSPQLGIALTELAPGCSGRLLADDLDAEERNLLEALGCPHNGRFTLCKAGSPWILRVHGTRIGVSHEVALRLRVVDIDP